MRLPLTAPAVVALNASLIACDGELHMVSRFPYADLDLRSRFGLVSQRTPPGWEMVSHPIDDNMCGA